MTAEHEEAKSLSWAMANDQSPGGAQRSSRHLAHAGFDDAPAQSEQDSSSSPLSPGCAVAGCVLSGGHLGECVKPTPAKKPAKATAKAWERLSAPIEPDRTGGGPVCHCRKNPCECPMDVEFGCDPGDSAALEKLRMAIDDHCLWPTEEGREAGDYESAIEYTAHVAKMHNAPAVEPPAAISKSETTAEPAEAGGDGSLDAAMSLAGRCIAEGKAFAACDQLLRAIELLRDAAPPSPSKPPAEPERDYSVLIEALRETAQWYANEQWASGFDRVADTLEKAREGRSE